MSKSDLHVKKIIEKTQILKKNEEDIGIHIEDVSFQPLKKTSSVKSLINDGDSILLGEQFNSEAYEV